MGATTNQTFACSIFPSAHVTSCVFLSTYSQMWNYSGALFYVWISWPPKTEAT